MRIEIHVRGLKVDDSARMLFERRFKFSLTRLNNRVGRVDVYLSDMNGPRGGVDKRCQIVAEVLGLGQIVVEDKDSDLTNLIDRAAGRLGQTVRRRIARDRLRQRQRTHGIAVVN
ncbi:MAG: HPF/RaiA family ribosome-associated protein [Zavarzinella sp.]